MSDQDRKFKEAAMAREQAEHFLLRTLRSEALPNLQNAIQSTAMALALIRARQAVGRPEAESIQKAVDAMCMAAIRLQDVRDLLEPPKTEARPRECPPWEAAARQARESEKETE